MSFSFQCQHHLSFFPTVTTPLSFLIVPPPFYSSPQCHSISPLSFVLFPPPPPPSAKNQKKKPKKDSPTNPTNPPQKEHPPRNPRRYRPRAHPKLLPHQPRQPLLGAHHHHAHPLDKRHLDNQQQHKQRRHHDRQQPVRAGAAAQGVPCAAQAVCAGPTRGAECQGKAARGTCAYGGGG